MKITFSGVCERDLDLFLIEELVADRGLLAWLFGRCALGEPLAEETSLTHSAVAGNGESDVEIRTKLRDGRNAVILIENKVDASFQPRQAERYRERAENYRLNGATDTAVTLLFAPALYVGEASGNHGFDFAFTYEELRDWILGREQHEPRFHYKELLLQAAIEKCGKGYSMSVDGTVSDFWRVYWELASESEPGLNLIEPKGKPSGATFVTFSPPGLPKGLSIWHKLDRGFVDLQFDGWGDRAYDLDRLTAPFREQGMTVEKTSKSAAIRLTVPRLNVARPACEQSIAIRDGLAAAGRMLRWVREHEPALKAIPSLS